MSFFSRKRTASTAPATQDPQRTTPFAEIIQEDVSSFRWYLHDPSDESSALWGYIDSGRERTLGAAELKSRAAIEALLAKKSVAGRKWTIDSIEEAA